jgi:hypothetical protein
MVAGIGVSLFASDQAKGDATEVMTQARTALGGDKNLTAIKSFVVTGRTRRLRGENVQPIEFEIACELPDKFVRKDEFPAEESAPTSFGFNGDTLLQIPPPAAPPARAGGPPAAAGRAGGDPPAAGRGVEPPAAGRGAPPDAARAGAPPQGGAPGGAPPGPRPAPPATPINRAKQDFARLTLGMFAGSFAGYPLTFTRVGQAEAPQGKADVIEVKADKDPSFTVRFFINSQTHQPIMLSWQQPPTNVIVTVPGQKPPANVAAGTLVVEGPPAPAATAPKEEVDKYAKDVKELQTKNRAKLVEHRLYYLDYRDAGNGVTFPFLLRRAIGPDTIEETRFDNFRFNSRIDPRKFEVPK